MRNPVTHVNDERGIAMVMAVVMLLVVAMIAIVLMVNLQVERKLSGNDVRQSAALNVAEAGVGEAVARIRNGDIALNTAVPNSAAMIFLASAGSVPVVGADTTALDTKQPAGAWLNYSTAARSGDVLTVGFKKDAAGTAIYRYDSTKNPPIQTTSGLPVYSILSTGRDGANKVRVVTEVIQKPFNAMINAAFCADQGINFSGNSFVCGENHSGTTPVGTRDPGNCLPYETGSGDLPGSWSSGAISPGGSSFQAGSPVNNSPNQTGFYAGPWSLVQMGQAEFYAWVGNPVSAEPNPANGIYYLDNNATKQDHSGDFAYHGGTGEGFLYVDGDLTVNGNFDFKGVIYVEGDVKINGTFWLLGAMIVKGTTTVKIANGNAAILYSSEAIQTALAKYGGQFVTLSWRQIPLN